MHSTVLVIGKEGVGWGVRPLALLGTGWIALRDERFESLWVRVLVIGGGERWRCRWSGHSWVALSDRMFES